MITVYWKILISGHYDCVILRLTKVHCRRLTNKHLTIKSAVNARLAKLIMTMCLLRLTEVLIRLTVFRAKVHRAVK